MSSAALRQLEEDEDHQRLAPTREALSELLELAGALFDEADAARIELAAQWMVALHLPQAPRKDGKPYVSHTTEVARRVLEWCPSAPAGVVIAAMLHDSVEDQAAGLAMRGSASTGSTRDRALHALAEHFGAEVSRRVGWLSNPEDGAGPAPSYAEHVARAVAADPQVSVIKLADFSTNAWALDAVRDPRVRARLVTKYRPVMAMFLRMLTELDPDHPLAGSREALLARMRKVWGRDYAR